MIFISLLITALAFLSAGFFLAQQNSKMHSISAAILTTAGSVYGVMAYSHYIDPDVALRPLRYLDWFITVPMMIYQIGLITKASKFNLIYNTICAIVMLGIGLLGELGEIDKTLAVALGTFCVLSIFIPLLTNLDYRVNEIVYLTLIGWLFYPIVYMFADTTAIIYTFSVVDLSVKLGLSYNIYKKIS